MDHLGLVETVDRLGERVVVTVADAADGRLYPGFGQALGVLDGHVLRPAVRMMDEAAAALRAPLVQGLFEGVEDEACVCGAAGAPAHDPPGVGVAARNDARLDAQSMAISDAH